MKRLFVMLVAAAVVLMPACRKKGSGDTTPVEPAPGTFGAKPSTPRFKTLTFTSKLTWVDETGNSKQTSTGTLKTTIDAVSNRVRYDYTGSDGVTEGELFDGKDVWRFSPSQKTAVKTGTRDALYAVWDEFIYLENNTTDTDNLHGTVVKVAKIDGTTYWIYKGVKVQEKVTAQRFSSFSELSGPIIEDATVDPSVFSIPANYKRS